LLDAHGELGQFAVMPEMPLYRQLGRTVAARRKELRLTQVEVAVQLGLTRASLANLENGRQRIMLHQLFRLMHALQLKSILDLVPPDWTFDDEVIAPELHGSALNSRQESSVHQFFRNALAPEKNRKTKV
jgi:transcriptional regulator with XRE-family HTH domain